MNLGIVMEIRHLKLQENSSTYIICTKFLRYNARGAITHSIIWSYIEEVRHTPTAKVSFLYSHERLHGWDQYEQGKHPAHKHITLQYF